MRSDDFQEYGFSLKYISDQETGNLSLRHIYPSVSGFFFFYIRWTRLTDIFSYDVVSSQCTPLICFTYKSQKENRVIRSEKKEYNNTY